MALPSATTHCDGELWVGVDGPWCSSLSSGRWYDLASAWGRAKGRYSRNNYGVSKKTEPMASIFFPDSRHLRVKIYVWGPWFLETASWNLGAHTLPCLLLWVWVLDLRTREKGWVQALTTYSLHRASERMQNESFPSVAPLMPQTPDGWEAFVAILISQVQRGLRYMSILSSLLSFCILSCKTKVSMEHIQKGAQERNLDQLWLNPNLITTLEGKCWPVPVVGRLSWSCLHGSVW